MRTIRISINLLLIFSLFFSLSAIIHEQAYASSGLRQMEYLDSGRPSEVRSPLARYSTPATYPSVWFQATYLITQDKKDVSNYETGPPLGDLLKRRLAYETETMQVNAGREQQCKAIWLHRAGRGHDICFSPN